MDTAPLLSVADTSVLMSLSDIRLLIIRHAFSKKGGAQALQNGDQIGLNFDGLVLMHMKSLRILWLLSVLWRLRISILCEKYLSDSYDYEDE